MITLYDSFFFRVKYFGSRLFIRMDIFQSVIFLVLTIEFNFQISNWILEID